MKFIRLAVVALVTTSIIYAGDINGNVVVGGAIGAAAGSAVGSAIGGKDGAIIGAGAGGIIGAAIASDEKPKRNTRTRVIQRETILIRDRSRDHNVHYDQGRHLGHYKKKHKHKYEYNRDHDRDYDRNRERYYDHDRYRGRDW